MVTAHSLSEITRVILALLSFSLFIIFVFVMLAMPQWTNCNLMCLCTYILTNLFTSFVGYGQLGLVGYTIEGSNGASIFRFNTQAIVKWKASKYCAFNARDILT